MYNLAMSNMIIANELNESFICKKVSYTPYIDENFSPEAKKIYFETVKQVLNDVAKLKDNPAYCQFISEKIGFDLKKGFDNFKEQELELHVYYNGNDYKESAFFNKDPDGYQFQLEIADYSIENRSNNTLRTGISHEIGHLLIYAGLDIEESGFAYNDSEYKGAYRSDYRHNWALELIADKISIASNLQNNTGQYLAETKNQGTWLNQLAQKSWFPTMIAKGLSSFCKFRDEVVLGAIGNKEQSLLKLNNLFSMNCSLTHPSEIVRAVEGKKFAKECRNFLNNPNP